METSHARTFRFNPGLKLRLVDELLLNKTQQKVACAVKVIWTSCPFAFSVDIVINQYNYPHLSWFLFFYCLFLSTADQFLWRLSQNVFLYFCYVFQLEDEESTTTKYTSKTWGHSSRVHVLQSVSKIPCEEDVVSFTRHTQHRRHHGAREQWITVEPGRSDNKGVARMQRMRTEAAPSSSRRVTSRPSARQRPTRLLNHLRAVCSPLLLPRSSPSSPRCFTTFLRSMMDFRTLRTKGLFTATR